MLLVLEQIYKRRRTGGQNRRRLKRIDNNKVLVNLTVFQSSSLLILKYNYI